MLLRNLNSVKSSCGTKRFSDRVAGNKSWRTATMQGTNSLTQETATDRENPVCLSVPEPYCSVGSVYLWAWMRHAGMQKLLVLLYHSEIADHFYYVRNCVGIRVIVFVIVINFLEAVPSRRLWCVVAFLLTTPSNGKTARFLFSVVSDSWSRNHYA